MSTLSLEGHNDVTKKSEVVLKDRPKIYLYLDITVEGEIYYTKKYFGKFINKYE